MDSAPSSPTRKARSGSEKRQRADLAWMRLTPAERAQLDELAERAGMTVSAYMRHQCLGSAGPRAVRRPPVERAALAQLLGQLGKVGSNVNQIARALNTDRPLAYDITTTLAEIREAALSISATLRGKGA
ncbi:plasmid mobilization relaxosome protein MobC [Paeniroseomonas aquatica]|uniref:Plasmid mobilization relaxosome protein MobC n=1 Tax=Paeniroseomonas aquatica TaxID=373043 RepID=A0ABT8AFX4_9PROT|nr:plasmid mobilization relaxosome protein MobC [Paeniroseomonas aquatica]MDN3568717.1 plasmid mobilization relaxosome protein MobC [Paeniroseomonas aquatica]